MQKLPVFTSSFERLQILSLLSAYERPFISRKPLSEFADGFSVLYSRDRFVLF